MAKPDEDDLYQVFLRQMDDPGFRKAVETSPDGPKLLEAYGTMKGLMAQPGQAVHGRGDVEVIPPATAAALDQADQRLREGMRGYTGESPSVFVGAPQVVSRTPMPQAHEMADVPQIDVGTSAAVPPPREFESVVTGQPEPSPEPPPETPARSISSKPIGPAGPPSAPPPPRGGQLDELLDAQGMASNNRMWANLARAGSNAASAIATGVDRKTGRPIELAPTDDQYFQGLTHEADRPIAEAAQLQKERLTLAATDPGAPKNVRARQALASMLPGVEKRPGFNLLTEADIPRYLESEKLRGELDNKAKLEADRKADNDRADKQLGISRDQLEETKRHQRYTELHPAVSQLASTRKDALTARLAASMTSQLDPQQWHGPIAKQVEASNQAQHLLALAENAAGDINNLSGPEQEELAMGFARLIAGGHGTEGQVKNLIPPKTLQSGAAGLIEWLRNEPQGRNQVEFVRRMAHSVERQKSVADGLITQEQAKRAGSHRKLKELDPEQHQAVLEQFGLDPSGFDGHGVYRQPSADAAPAPAVIEVDGVRYKRGPKGEAIPL